MRWDEIKDEKKQEEAKSRWKNPPFQTGKSQTISTCRNIPASILPDHEDSVRGKILTYLCRLKGRSFDHALEAMTIAVETNLSIELQKSIAHPVATDDDTPASRDAEISRHVHRSMSQTDHRRSAESTWNYNSALLSTIESFDTHIRTSGSPTDSVTTESRVKEGQGGSKDQEDVRREGCRGSGSEATETYCPDRQGGEKAAEGGGKTE